MNFVALTRAAVRSTGRGGGACIVRCLVTTSNQHLPVARKSQAAPSSSFGLRMSSPTSTPEKMCMRYMAFKVSSPALLKDRDDRMEIATTVQDKGGWGSTRLFDETSQPGSKAFVECDRAALIDLFNEYANECNGDGCHLDRSGLKEILRSVGENADDETVDHLFRLADDSGDDLIQLDVSYCSSSIYASKMSVSIRFRFVTHSYCLIVTSFRNFYVHLMRSWAVHRQGLF